MSVLKSEQKKKNVNKSLSEKKIYRLYDSLLRNKKNAHLIKGERYTL